MKKLHKAFLIAALATSALALMACNNDDDDNNNNNNNNNNTPTASLPTSVGENIFSGKTFTDESNGITWKFSTNTVVQAGEFDDSESQWTCCSQWTYRYSYNTEKSILYLALMSYSESGTKNGESYSDSYSSVDEYVAIHKKNSPDGVTWTEDAISYFTDLAKSNFALQEVYKYEISGNTISCEDYFDGSLPTECEFRSSDNAIKLESQLRIHSNSEEYDKIRAPYLSYSNGKFSGNIYGESYNSSEKTDHFTLLGKVEGTYSTSGTGTEGSDCTVKLTFTAIPNAVTSASDVAEGTEYTLTF